MIRFVFHCDVLGCARENEFYLIELSVEKDPTPTRHGNATFFDTALHLNRESGWRVKGNGKDLPQFDCKVFCPDHVNLYPED